MLENENEYKITELEIDYSWNDVHIKKIELVCGSAADSKEIVVENLEDAISTVENLYSLIIWHTPIERIFSLAKDTSLENPAAGIPVIVNDRMMSYDKFVNEFLQPFNGPSVQIAPESFVISLVLAIAAPENWCPLMHWTRDFKKILQEGDCD